MKIHILSIILAFLLSGCVMDDYGNHCPDPEDDGAGYVTVSFKLITPTVSQSRADENPNHYETDSDWPSFENLIKADDFAFFIFADKDNTSGSWPLVLKMTDINNSTDPTMMITGYPGAYTVTAKIPKDNLGQTIEPNNTTPMYFRIVVLANVGKPEYDDLYTASDILNAPIENHSVTTYTEFFGKAEEWRFDVNSLYNDTPASFSTKDIFNKEAAIPMFGLKKFTITEDKLYYSRPEERIWIGEISMLRALAKIRVIDNITTRNESTGLPRVEHVTFQGRTLLAYDLPHNANEYINGMQVETARPASPTGDTENYGRPLSLAYLKDTDSTVFTYIPEQPISYGYPQINVTITYEVDESGKPSVQKTFTVPMTGYNNQSFDFGKHILRNHIYTLAVDLENMQLNLNVAVKDWRTLEYKYEY